MKLYKVTLRRTYEHNVLVHANNEAEAVRDARDRPTWDINHALLVDLSTADVVPLGANVTPAAAAAQAVNNRWTEE